MRSPIRWLGFLAALAVTVVAAGRVVEARLPSLLERRLSQLLGSEVHWVVDPVRQQWRLTAAPAGGTVTVQGPLHHWRRPMGEIVIHDVKTGPVTLSTTAQWEAAWTAWPPGLRGTLSTTGTTVNHQPVSELSGAWRASAGQATISDVALGARCRASGSVGWFPPYPLALTVDLTEADAARIAVLIEPGKNPLAGGIVRGRVAVTGTAGAPRVQGALSARHGKLGATAFEAADIQFEGEGTVLRFTHTRLQQPGAEVVVEGFLDVTKLGTPTVFQDMRLTPRPLAAPVTARMAAQRQAPEEAS